MRLELRRRPCRVLELRELLIVRVRFDMVVDVLASVCAYHAAPLTRVSYKSSSRTAKRVTDQLIANIPIHTVTELPSSVDYGTKDVHGGDSSRGESASSPCHESMPRFWT